MVGNTTLHIDMSVLQFLVYTALPWLVALVTRRFADSRVKSGILAVLALLVAILQEGIAAGGDFDLGGLAGRFVTALVVAFVTHEFVWKPLAVTGDNGALMKLVPGGVGQPTQFQMAKARGTNSAV